MKHLFVSDLDGTLLNGDSLVSPRSAEIITDLTGQGAAITVATARTPATVTRLLADTHISLPAIVFTGAAEYDLNQRRYTSARLLDVDTAADIEETILREGIFPMRYTLGSDNIIHAFYNGTSTHPSMQKFIDERCRLTLKRMHIGEHPSPELIPRTVLLFAMGNYDAINRAAETLRHRGGCYVSCYTDPLYPDAGVIEVYADGVSKADAVKQLARRIGADRIIVFGDNLNDIPMMKIADEAVAVENAMPQVKEMAHTIIGPNTSDSVAEYIRKVYEEYRGS